MYTKQWYNAVLNVYFCMCFEVEVQRKNKVSFIGLLKQGLIAVDPVCLQRCQKIETLGRFHNDYTASRITL